MRRRGLVTVVLALGTATASQAQAALQEVPTPSTDGAVTALAQLGGRVYAGGLFTYTGPVTGSGVQLDPAGGAVTSASPRFDGQVLAATPDGAGGFIVGGAFTAIDGKPHAPLARILPSGGLDPNYDPHPDAPVTSLLPANGKVYVGGFFTTIGGKSRNKLAALDPVTGAVDPNFDANVSGGAVTRVPGNVQLATASQPFYSSCYGGFGGAPEVQGNGVFALASKGGRLFVGGSFGGIGGVERNNIAAVDVNSGAIDGSFIRGDTDGPVFALATSATRLYVGGAFWYLGNNSRARLASINVDSGLADEQFEPSVDDTVSALAVNDQRLFVGGSFTHIAGVGVNRLASVDPASGVPIGSFPGADGPVTSLLVTPSRLFVGGGFRSVGGVSRLGLAAVDPTSGAVASGFAPAADGAASALALGSKTLFAGGTFKSIGGFARPGLAAFDAASGALVPGFAPPLPPVAVATMVAGGGRIYAEVARGNTRALIAMDAATGATDPNFKPRGFKRRPTELALDGNRLYLGGFEGRGGTPVIALDAHSGAPLSGFKFGSHDGVSEMTVYKSKLIAAGAFRTGRVFKRRFGKIEERIGLMAFDARTGKRLKGWGRSLHWLTYPNPGYIVQFGARLYIGGGLTDKHRHGLGESLISAASGARDPRFHMDARQQILTADASRVWVTGGFGTQTVEAVNAVTGKAIAGMATPPLTGQACSAVSTGNRLWVGGVFSTVGGELQPGLAAFGS